nr:hypothetical protein [Tanacetum cinerariifolium]
MTNPEDITDPTTAVIMALALMAKAFKLNYSTPTNNNKRISSNPRNRQIAQPGMNMCQDRQMQIVGGNDGNQFRQYAGQNEGNPAGYNDVIRNQLCRMLFRIQGFRMLEIRMAKAFKLNYSTPTNNNKRISSNPRNRQIAQPGINMCQDRQMQMVGESDWNGNQVAARAEGNAAGENRNQIRCYNCRGV